jgi:hypothetical protein
MGSSSNLKLKLRGPNQNKIWLEMKTTSDGRQHQNIKSEISQQPLLGYSSNFELKIRGPNQNKIWLEMKMTSIVRRRQNIKSEIS